MKTIHNPMLTDTQINRKAIALTKKWIKEKGYKYLQCYTVKGTFHINNCHYYMLSAKSILEQATGLQFTHMTTSMAKRVKTDND